MTIIITFRIKRRYHNVLTVQHLCSHHGFHGVDWAAEHGQYSNSTWLNDFARVTLPELLSREIWEQLDCKYLSHNLLDAFIDTCSLIAAAPAPLLGGIVIEQKEVIYRKNI